MLSCTLRLKIVIAMSQHVSWDFSEIVYAQKYVNNKKQDKFFIHSYLIHLMKSKILNCTCHCCLVSKSCLTLLQPHELQPARLLSLWDFVGKNSGVGCLFLLQGIFPLTQGLKLHQRMAGRFFTTEPPRSLNWSLFNVVSRLS